MLTEVQNQDRSKNGPKNVMLSSRHVEIFEITVQKCQILDNFSVIIEIIGIKYF